jgi:subtilisin-like proprotein convertase family protein
VDARRGTAPPGRFLPVAPVEAVDTYFIAPFDLEALLAEDSDLKEGPLQFAEPVYVAITPETHGTIESLADGSRLWRLRIDAPGATDLNLGFGRFRLPPDATLHVASEILDYYEGPYTWQDNSAEHGELWLPVTPGSRAVIELHVPARVKFEPELELRQIGWGFRDLFRLEGPVSRQGWCNNDVICPVGDPWRDEIASEGVYQRSGMWVCSGQMLTNLSGDFAPYFLTANHCGITSGNDHTVVVYWNYESPNCGDLCCGDLSDNQIGSTLRATRSNSDFCLIELDDPPDTDSNVFWSGWDAGGGPVSSCVAIHHPGTDEKAISFNTDPLTITSYLGTSVPGDGTHWRVNNWEDGTTEGGSSGSGIWDPNHRLVGQLHGGYASCSSITSDWYGRLSVSWDGSSSSTRLRDWLDPGNTGQRIADGSFPDGVGSLRYVSHSGLDKCSTGFGHANGIWEPGETIAIPVTVRASGGDHTNVTGVLTTTTPGVTVTRSFAGWPDIPSGSSATSYGPHFAITVDETLPCYDTIDFTLTMSSAEGGPWPITFDQLVGQPAFPTDLPVSIPDGSGSVTSSFTVGQNDVITDLNVRVKITHTWVGDLRIQLRGPSGTTITLLDRPGHPASTYGCSDDNMDVTFDDASGFDPESHCAGTDPWYSGVAAPVQALSVFNGQSTQGTWDLIVSDHASADTGTLDEWELLATPPIGGVCEVCPSDPTDALVTSPTASTFLLAQNRPNPFSPSTVIEFRLPSPEVVTLEVFDVSGRRITTLVDGVMPAGPHAITWDGTDSDRGAVAAGTYFYRLRSGDETRIRRMILVR